MTTNRPSEIFMMRVSAAFRFCPMIGISVADPTRLSRISAIFPRKLASAERISITSAGIGSFAGLHRLLPLCFKLPIATVQPDLAGGNLDLERMKAMADRGCLLVHQLYRNTQVCLDFAGTGLLLVHQVEKSLAVFGKTPEGGVCVGGEPD